MLIFSTSPLGVFQQSFLIAGGFLVFGVIGFVIALFRRMRKIKSWLGLGISCLFLIAIGIVMLVVTIKNMSTDTQIVTARLDQKTVAQENCEAGINCNNDYILSMTVPPKTYDFTVAKATYDSTQTGLCYQVTYYPSNGLFAANIGTDLYVATSYITNIAQMNQDACPQ